MVERAGGIPSTGLRRMDRDGLVAAVLLAVALGLLGWVRHRNFWSGAFDLGIFDQAVWQLSEGRAHVSLVNRNVFADHFSPVLTLFAPLYWISATPLWLIAVQAVAVGLTVLPLRALARDLLVAPWIATVLVAASAPLFAAALFDFHPSTLAVPWVALLLLHARRDNPGWALVSAGAILACRGDLGLVVAATAIVAGARTRRPLLLVGLVGAALGAAVPMLGGETTGWAVHYGHLGSGPVDAALHPWRLAVAPFEVSFVRPLTTWVLAAGCLVVLRPRWLLALTVAGLPVLLSRWGASEQPWFHYGAPMAPIAVGGTLAALGEGPPTRSTAVRIRPSIVVGGLVVALSVASPLASSAPDQFRLWDVLRPAPHRDAEGAIALVGEHEAASLDNQLVPHLAHREHVYMFPLPFEVPPGFLQGGAPPDLRGYPPGLVDVVVAPSGTSIDGYAVVDRVEGFVVLRRR